MGTAKTQNNKIGVAEFVRLIVIRQGWAVALVSEEPDDEKVTSGSVGSAAE